MNKEVQIIISARDMFTQPAKGMEETLSGLTEQAKALGSEMTKAGKSLSVGLTTPLTVLMVTTGKMAMDIVESENLAKESFGDMISAAESWSKELRDKLRVNEYEVRRNAAMFNVMFKSMEMGERAAYDMAKGLTELSYDMASFYNVAGGAEQAVRELRAGIMGESEPLKKYGIIVNETTIKNWALTNGLIKQGEQLSEQQKIWARYNVIMEATRKAQGDLARTIDSPANKLRVATEEIKTAGMSLGNEVIPIFTDLIDPVIDLVQWFTELPPSIKETAVQFGVLAAAIGPVTTGIGLLLNVLSGPAGLAIGISTVVAGLAMWARYSQDVSGRIEQQLSSTTRAINEAKGLAEKYGDQAKRLNELIPRYEQLRSKTNKSTSEHKELRNIIDEIVQIAPQAVTGYDNMGRALIGNADAAKRASKELWQLRREHLEIAAQRAEYELPRLQEIEKELSPELNRLKKELDLIAPKYFQVLDVVGKVDRAKTEAEKQKIIHQAIADGIINATTPLATQFHVLEQQYNSIFKNYINMSEAVSKAKLGIIELKNAQQELDAWLKMRPEDTSQKNTFKSLEPPEKLRVSPEKRGITSEQIIENLNKKLKEIERTEELLGELYDENTAKANAYREALYDMVKVDPQNANLKSWAEYLQKYDDDKKAAEHAQKIKEATQRALEERFELFEQYKNLPQELMDEEARIAEELTEKIMRNTLTETEYKKWSLEQQKKKFEEVYGDNMKLVELFTQYYQTEIDKMTKKTEDFSFKNGLNKALDDTKTWSERMQDLGKDTGEALEETFSQTISSIGRGFKGLADVATNVLNRIYNSLSELVGHYFFKYLMNNFFGGTTTPSNNTTVPSGTQTPGRAYGGPVSAGTLYRVNEPWSPGEIEFFRPNVSGEVIPLGAVSTATVPSVQVNVISNGANPAVKEEPLKFDGKQWVKNVVLDFIATDPNFRKALQGV